MVCVLLFNVGMSLWNVTSNVTDMLQMNTALKGDQRKIPVIYGSGTFIMVTIDSVKSLSVMTL